MSTSDDFNHIPMIRLDGERIYVDAMAIEKWLRDCAETCDDPAVGEQLKGMAENFAVLFSMSGWKPIAPQFPS